MKTKLFYTLLTCFVIGMVIPTFAISPDKDKGDKTKADNLTSLLPPPPTRNLIIQAMDPYDSCYAMISGNCIIGFFIQPRGPSCGAVIENPNFTQQFVYGQAYYNQLVPDSIPCYQVSIIVISGNCTASDINANTCCKCRGDNTPCKLRICP